MRGFHTNKTTKVKTREIILIIAILILLFLYLCKDVEVVEKQVIVHDTIVNKTPIFLSVQSKTVNISQKPLQVDIYQHYVPRVDIKQGNPIKLVYVYKYKHSAPNETINKFENRLYLGAYTNFANTNSNSQFIPSGYTWSESGLELLYVRDKMYYGLSAGLTQNRFDYQWARNSVIDGVVGIKLGIKIK